MSYQGGRTAESARDRIARGYDGTCPVCRRVYAVSVPPRGDGSARILRRHAASRTRATDRILCGGSRLVRVEDRP